MIAQSKATSKISITESLSQYTSAKNLLNAIFIAHYGKYLSLINSHSIIYGIPLFFANNIIDIKEKVILIQYLTELFNKSDWLIPLVNSAFEHFHQSIFDPIISIYLNADTQEAIDIAFTCLELLSRSINCTKDSLEEIYQSLSKIYSNEAKREMTEERLINHMNLLKVFYLQKERYNKKEHKSIRNYFYFSGIPNGLSVDMNSQCEDNHIKMTSGFYITFWVWIESDIRFRDNDISKEINLFNGLFDKGNLKLSLESYNRLYVTLRDRRSDIEELEGTLNDNNWNNITMRLTSRGHLYIYVNSKVVFHLKNSDLKSEGKISNMSFGENFIGKITSVLFFNYDYGDKPPFPNCAFGFCKRKYITNGIKEYRLDYLSNAKTLKTKNREDNDITDEKRNKDLKHKMMLYTPFSYNSTIRKVDDLCNGPPLILPKYTGITIFSSYNKDINMLGGINNLLPLIEMMYISQNPSIKTDYPLLTSDILTAQTFLVFIDIISIIITNRPKNLAHANHCEFFSSLALFIENFPKEIFNQKILEKLLDIINSEITEKDSNDTSINQASNRQHSSFIEKIILNEKIIAKFSPGLQGELWEKMNQLIEKDVQQSKRLFDLFKICIILKFYDSNKELKFCCRKHAGLFEIDNIQKKVICPELIERTKHLLKTVKFLIESAKDKKDVLTLMKFLALDLSPCLQKEIIKILIQFFSIEEEKNDFLIISSKKDKGSRANPKQDILLYIISENGYDLLLYTLSVSLLDVRCELVNLIIQLINDYPTCFNDILKEQIIIFITRNILPYNLKYQSNKLPSINHNNDHMIIDNDTESNNVNSIQMTNQDDSKDDLNPCEISYQSIHKDSYIDKAYSNPNHRPLYELFIESAYKEQVHSMWHILITWFNKAGATLYTNYLLNFLIQLSTTTEATYILCLTKTLLAKMKESKSLFNIKDEYIRVRFYDWIIEIIFIYSLNLDKEATQENSKAIVLNGQEILRLIMKHKEDNGKKTRKILRMISYAEHFERSYQEVTLKQKKRIVRELLLIMMESENDFDNKAMISFEFILRNNSSLKYDHNNNQVTMFIIDNFIIDIVDLIKSNMNNSISLETNWEDYILVNRIIDNYFKRISLDFLCTQLNLSPFSSDISQRIVHEYGFNKKTKNKLLEQLLQLLSLNNKASLLKIIIFLLSILIQFTNDEDRLNEIASKYEEVLIFCILSSINILPSHDDYDIIQHELGECILFGLCYFKLKLEGKYEMILNDYINPIITTGDTQSEQKNVNSFMKLFNDKKLDITGSAVYKLFKFAMNNQRSIEICNEDTISFERFIILNDYVNIFNDASYKKHKSLIPIFFHNDYNNKIIKKEKERISSKVKDIIPFWEKRLKEHSNGEFLEQKIIRHLYKNVKKALFSWRGFWSHRYIFYEQPHLLKQKLINHYTTEMTRPILAPIIDIDYYLPTFTKFKLENLFFKDNYNYRINLNIDSIFSCKSEDNDHNNQEDTHKNLEGIIYLLKDCYALTYPEIWNHIDLAQKKINLDKGLTKEETQKIISPDYTQSIPQGTSQEQILPQKNMYKCCIVKQMNHCNGILSLDNSKLRFVIITNTSSTDNNTDSHSNHMDNERHTCYGSFITKYPKSKDMFTFIINYSIIKFFFKRTYFYTKTAIEIFTTRNKAYYINFNSQNDRETFVSQLLNHMSNYSKIQSINRHIIGYQIIDNDKEDQKDKNNLITLQNMQTNWARWRISTMEYLMWLNIFSNRSFNDLTQYPVFPWVIASYDCDLTKYSLMYRDLNQPMGMLNLHEASKQRKESYKMQYETMKKEYDEQSMNEIQAILTNQKPYLFGSHYSNPTYVSYYLTRIFPYANILIEIQGSRFDDPDRLFNSIIRSFECAITQKCDVRELIPEFYYFPEMLLNINNLNLAQVKEGKRDHTVILPKWAKCQFSFISKHREILESKAVNSHINDWIDLIFGIYQQGKRADEKNNVFTANTYEKKIKLNLVTDEQERAALLRLVEMGMSPHQILSDKSITKLEANIYGKTIFESTKTECSNCSVSNLRNKRMLKMKLHGNDRMSIIQNDTLFTVNFNYHEGSEKIVKENKTLAFQCESSLCSIKQKMQRYYSESVKDWNSPPILIYGKGLIIAMGGFWDGRIEIISINIKTGQSEMKYLDCDNYSPVVIMEMDKSESLVICGTLLGRVNVYKAKLADWELMTSLYDHNKEITGITINSTLNVFATTAKDGYIMLYLLPSNTLVRSIKLDKKIIGDYLFISALPLPEIVINNKRNHMFVCYSINGSLITQLVDKHVIKNEEKLIEMYSPKVFTTPSFVDYLIYGTNIGYIIIRSFPMMTHIIMIGVSQDIPIRMIELSEDSNYCYAYSGEGENIIAVHDTEIYVQNVTRLFNEYGFCV